MFLYDVVKALKKEKLKFAIVGGYALALHGIVRATMDVDVVIGLTLGELTKAEAAMAALGLTSRLPVSAHDVATFREEYIENRNLLAWSFIDYKDPTKQVDILIVTSIGAIETETAKVAGINVPVATLKSLLKMKLAANRPEDQMDILNIRRKIDEA